MSTAWKVPVGLTPTTWFFKFGPIVSIVRQFGHVASVSVAPDQPESMDLVQGGLPTIRLTSSITFERLIYRPNPKRTAVLPSPLTSQARPKRGCQPAFQDLTRELGRPWAEAFAGVIKAELKSCPSKNCGTVFVI